MNQNSIGNTVRHYEELTSTNDTALDLAAAGAPEGAVVRADAQTGGRGRIGRTWNSGRGKGLYLSVILRPQLPVKELGLLSLAAGAAVRAALRSAAGLDALIKWPNDVLVNGKKIAGVLMESRAGDSGVEYIVLGIGVNTDWDDGDLRGDFRVPPTAVNLETGVPAQQELLFSTLLAELDRIYREICSGKAERLIREVSDSLDRRGGEIILALPDRRISGILEGITAGGGLALRVSGSREIFFSGELDYADRY